MSPPLAEIGVNELQLPSGVGVLPVRTLSTTEVRRGVGGPRQRSPVGALAGVEDARGEAPRARIGAHVQPVDRDLGAAAVEVAGDWPIWVEPKFAAWVATRLPST